MSPSTHQAECLSLDNPNFGCSCAPYDIDEDDRMIAEASRPTAAELLRRAKERGWTKPLTEYEGQAKSTEFQPAA